MADYQTYSTDWEGFALSINYCPDWLGAGIAHLEIRSIDGQPLPVTETGYRSHFTNADLIDAEGGPVAFALAWLDHEAQSAKWKAAKAKRRQLSLF